MCPEGPGLIWSLFCSPKAVSCPGKPNASRSHHRRCDPPLRSHSSATLAVDAATYAFSTLPVRIAPILTTAAATTTLMLSSLWSSSFYSQCDRRSATLSLFSHATPAPSQEPLPDCLLPLQLYIQSLIHSTYVCLSVCACLSIYACGKCGSTKSRNSYNFAELLVSSQ